MGGKLFFIFAIVLATAEAGFYRPEPGYRGLGTFSRNTHGAGRRRVVWRKAPVAGRWKYIEKVFLAKFR